MLTDIKLVIWDLDETFWDGTLSEGPIQAISENIERVKDLCHRGVMNSICSKNDFDIAKAELEKLQVWDYFVFPSIMWGPKGEQVRQIIERMKLRAVNVLVVDDNALNLEEIKYYNADINVLDPVDWAEVETADWGKEDRVLKRLNNYRLLESKLDAATTFVGDNESFLRKSNIRCHLSVLDLVNDDLDRVVEVLNRTNQLNFTKRRFRSGVAQLLHDLRRSQSVGYVVHVVDDYGDYGLCGFVSVSGNGTVDDFAFSCRLLDMGVERAILQYLGEKHDELNVPFQSELPDSRVDWVTIEEATGKDDARHLGSDRPVEGQPVAMMPVACFSEAIAPFMHPEMALVGLPEYPPLTADLVRKERSSSVIYWPRTPPEMDSLFSGKYNLLHISAAVEVMFPVVWLPVIGRIPLPMMTNTSILKSYPELLASLKQTIAERGDFFGRRLKESKERFDINFCLAISKIPYIASQSKMSPKRYLSSLNALRDRLPDQTKLVISLCSDDPDDVVFNGPWAVLNQEFASRANAANAVVREFAGSRPNVFLIENEGSTDEVANDFSGHLTHEQNFKTAQSLKADLLEILARQPG